jgi:hypothetical protein
VSIGPTLTDARLRAGLSVAQVSARTRIRETIIRGIEADDYAACGGDFYARGHIRSIARVLGVEPGPLIREYDATHRTAEEFTAAEAFQPVMPMAVRERQQRQQAQREQVQREQVQRPPPVVVPPPSAGPPSQAQGARRRLNLTALLTVVLLIVVGVLAYHVLSGPSHHPASNASSTGALRRARTRAKHSPVRAKRHTAPAPAAVRHAPQPQPLSPAGVVAFGPGGPGDGDNPGQASQAIGSPDTEWNTDWYATADFGNLATGTGLLLDMGRTVTITSVQFALGSVPGADLQLRVGSAPVLSDMQTVAQTNNAAGVVSLSFARPASGRYVLIWFTLLPPDSAGTFQASVSDVAVEGRP